MATATMTLHTKADALSIYSRMQRAQQQEQHSEVDVHSTRCIHEETIGDRVVQCQRRSHLAHHGWLCVEHLNEVDPPPHAVVGRDGLVHVVSAHTRGLLEWKGHA